MFEWPRFFKSSRPKCLNGRRIRRFFNAKTGPTRPGVLPGRVNPSTFRQGFGKGWQVFGKLLASFGKVLETSGNVWQRLATCGKSIVIRHLSKAGFRRLPGLFYRG